MSNNLLLNPNMCNIYTLKKFKSALNYRANLSITYNIKISFRRNFNESAILLRGPNTEEPNDTYEHDNHDSTTTVMEITPVNQNERIPVPRSNPEAHIEGDDLTNPPIRVDDLNLNNALQADLSETNQPTLTNTRPETGIQPRYSELPDLINSRTDPEATDSSTVPDTLSSAAPNTISRLMSETLRSLHDLTTNYVTTPNDRRIPDLVPDDIVSLKSAFDKFNEEWDQVGGQRLYDDTHKSLKRSYSAVREVSLSDQERDLAANRSTVLSFEESRATREIINQKYDNIREDNLVNYNTLLKLLNEATYDCDIHIVKVGEYEETTFTRSELSEKPESNVAEYSDYSLSLPSGESIGNETYNEDDVQSNGDYYTDHDLS